MAKYIYSEGNPSAKALLPEGGGSFETVFDLELSEDVQIIRINIPNIERYNELWFSIGEVKTASASTYIRIFANATASANSNTNEPRVAEWNGFSDNNFRYVVAMIMNTEHTIIGKTQNDYIPVGRVGTCSPLQVGTNKIGYDALWNSSYTITATSAILAGARIRVYAR